MTRAATPVLELSGTAPGGREIQLALHAGELATVLGPTTALLREATEFCCGLATPDGWSVRLLGKSWEALDEAQRRLLRARIGVMPADGGWPPHLAVADSVLLPALAHRQGTLAELRDRAAALCRRFGLPGLPLERPHALREEDLARAGLARALLSDPALLILENPIRSEAAAAVLPALLGALAAATGTACLWLTTSRAQWRDRTIPAAARYRLSPSGVEPARSLAA